MATQVFGHRMQMTEREFGAVRAITEKNRSTRLL